MSKTVRTIDFLPEIFQTTPNKQFLSSTLDTLVQQPKFDRVQGYIGSKFGYGVKSTDQYISEPTKVRNNYQLDPAIVFNKTGTKKAVDLLTYPGIIDAFKYNGSLTDNHNLLFSSDFYSWDSFVDLDKFINYSQYYWLPNGPEPVTVTSTLNYSQLTYKVSSSDYAYTFTTSKFNLSQYNPEITLIRGGTYQFQVDQETPFWIQTQEGVSGVDPVKTNLSTREVFGVSNNGINSGTITFEVPTADAQQSLIYPKGLEVNLVTTLDFKDIQGQNSKDIVIDGVEYLNEKTVVFLNAKPNDKGSLGKFYDSSTGSYDDSAFDDTTTTIVSKHYYKINYLSSGDEYIINLTEAGALPDNLAIEIKDGKHYIGRQLVKNSSDEIFLIPQITAPLNVLYYQDGKDSTRVGKIKLIDVATSDYIDIDKIIGQTTYTSPNKITFTNGLKVQFQGNIVPEKYLNDLFYVEGVGTSIQLIPVSEMQVPEKYSEAITSAFDDSVYGFDSISFSETFYVPVTPDYITINRSSLNRNAWARSNRWFHSDVLKTTIANNIEAPLASSALSSSTAMAKRPILEFYPNLKLFNYGSVSRGNVMYIDFATRDAMTTVAGNPSFDDSGNSLIFPDGPESSIADGTTVIFANDDRLEVRNKIYKAQITKIDAVNSPTLTGIIRKSGTQVKFSIPKQDVPPTVGRYYTVSGNTIRRPNPAYPNDRSKDLYDETNYNGTYIVTDSTQFSVTLLYPADPGTWGTDTTTTMTVKSEIVLSPIADVQYNDMVSVLSGSTFAGTSFYFNGTDWMPAQQKTYVNQPPFFDLYDYLGNSLGNPDYYPGTDFAGCTLFEYSKGTGNVDPILGFPLSYTSVDNLGDVQFNVTLNSQNFNYSYNGVSTTQDVSSAYVYNFSSNTDYVRNIGWQTAADVSYQNQVFNFEYTGTPTKPTFVLDVAMKDPSTTKWTTIVVYVDNVRQPSAAYTVTTTTNTTTVTLATAPAIGTTVDIMVYSDQVSKIGYYEIPINLDSNPFNAPVKQLTLGDVRGHYKSICNNIPNLKGIAFGANNFRDLGNLVPYGTRIIQNSAPLTLAAAFIRNTDNNFFRAASFNSYEYEKFKTLLVTSVDSMDINTLQPVADIFDTIMDNITSSGTKASPFFWSDMLPSKTPSVTKTYSFKTNLPISLFQLSKIYDFTTANYNGILVYKTTTTQFGTTVTMLTKDVDYFVSVDSPVLEIISALTSNDTITINEYAQTYGNFVPSTPTKLGMYPSFIPEIVYDETLVTPTFFIRGHDGSLTKLYGSYNDGKLSDLRDKLLLEFELRVYNNLKIQVDAPVAVDEIIPGVNRSIGYTNDQYMEMYSDCFLNWVGINRIDYKSQYYSAYNEYTWNYSGSTVKTSNTKLTQGHWRGIYLWLYDTVTPHTRPWEMLGLTKKPIWWDSHYGPAPYTSGNTLMWTDISNGVIWNNGNVIVNERRIRPDLLKMLPVDADGKLITPFSGVIGAYNFNNFKNEWKVGDVGPAEYAYRTSSTWAFDLMKMAAMQKSSFFTYNFDLDVYRYNREFNQFLVYDRLRTDVSNTNFYGTDETSAQHSYVNWIIDYQKQFGHDGTTEISNIFSNSDVRLVYRLAGFSDKSHLRFILEKSSGTASSLLIPEDSYDIMLYNNQTTSTLVYSSVIIQKTQHGYKVYGNRQIDAVFEAFLPKVGKLQNVTVNNATVQIPGEYSTTVETYPYGVEFVAVDELLTFVKGYGLYLESLGFQFNSVENSIALSWDQMLAEIFYWVQTGWEIGSIINVNPAATELTIDNGESIVQPLTLQKDNFVLNQNLLPVAVRDLAIDRDNTRLTVKTLNAGDTINLFNCTVSTLEHVVVFDNTTIFNDLIYNPVTGLRQQRIFMKGAKSAEWNGTLNAAGFIVSPDNIENWKPNTKYSKGIVVNYKNTYWMANVDVVQPNPEFDKKYWDETTYDMVRQNMVPNLSTKSLEAIKFYDPNRTNLANDADLLGFSLIGYRPRQYLADVGLDDASQVNLFKSMIESKGTNQSALGLDNIEINGNTISYKVHENWAIRNSEYAGVNNHNFVELELDQSLLTGNPSIVSIVSDTNVQGSQQQIPLTNVKNYARNIASPDILPTLTASSILQKLPSAGYVNTADVVEMGYHVDDLNDTNISNVYKGDYVWVADINGKWNVYTPVPSDATVITVINNMNGTITVQFNKPHNLVEKQLIGILNFDARLDGYYSVNSVSDLKSIVLTIGAIKLMHITNGSGTMFILQSHRVSTTRDIALLPNINEYGTDLVWVDENKEGDWTVYSKIPKYFINELPKGTLQTSNFGTSVANVPNLGYIVGDPEEGAIYHYRDNVNGDGNFFYDYAITHLNTTFGKTIVYGDDLMIVSAPDKTYNLSQIYIYRIPKESNIKFPVEEQVITLAGGEMGSAMALSGDGNILYVGAKDESSELLFMLARDPDLSFDNLGFTLKKPTVLNDDKFVVADTDGSVLASVKQGQRLSFVTQFTTIGVVATTITQANVNAGTNNYFSLEGDVTDKITYGMSISFAGLNSLYTVQYTYYNDQNDTTVAYVEQRITDGVSHSDPTTVVVGNGTVVSSATFSQDVTYTVITGIHNSDKEETTFYVVEKIQHISTTGASVYHARVNFQLVGSTNALVVRYGDNFGASIATNHDGSRVFVGSPNFNFTYKDTQGSNQTIPNIGCVWVGDATIENFQMKYDQNVQGATTILTLPWSPSANSMLYWNGKPLSTTKYVVIPGNVATNVASTVLVGPIGFKAGDILTFRSHNIVFSQYMLKTEKYSELRPGENFGYSVATNKTGSELFVGAPNGVYNNNQEGMVVRFTCEGKKFGTMTALTQTELDTPTYLFINGYRLNLFNIVNSQSEFIYGSTSITIAPADAAKLPAVGVITIQNIHANNYTMAYSSRNVTTGVITFATVFRPTNSQGQLNPDALKSSRYPDGTWPAQDIRITVPLGNAYSTQEKINSTGIPNVYAFVNDNNRLIVKLLDTDLGIADNKLNIMALNPNTITKLGMGTFALSQVITNPHPQHNSHFGETIKLDEHGSLAVGAPVANRHLNTTFDYDYTKDIHYSTVFDNNLATFADKFAAAGAVYIFDYIPCYNESLLNISNYIYGQSCNDVSQEYGQLPYYGKAIDFRNNMLMVGSPKFKVDSVGGKVTMYKNVVGTPNWSAFRYPDSVVDISKVNRAQIYNNINDKTTIALDYIDPLQGKLLGVVAENLDFISSIDPAGYNSQGNNKGNSVWNKSQVGKMWFDTSTTKFLDYHQNDVAYNSKYWGQVFPGSMTEVYSWVESINPPASYAETGTPYDVAKYSVAFITDSTGALIPMYYYWVKNTNKLFALQGKTLSDTVISGYISNPTNSGVPFMAPLRANTFGLYNTQQYINNTSSSLHLGYSTSKSNVPSHLDFKLVRTDYPEDFLSGFPNKKRGNPDPTGIYEKLIDSFAGSDSFGSTVPDFSLPKMMQVGINIRPRQSMFANRFIALQNLIELTNSIISEYPITEIDNLTLLSEYGDTYDTRLYWDYTYWWATGYSSTTKTNLEVQYYADLLTFTPTDNMIVGVAQNGNGKREVYTYSNKVWTRIGLEDGTIKFLSSLFDYANNKIGYGNDFFDSSGFDAHPTVESRFIVRAIFEQIFVNDLFKYRNKALVAMFEYIQSENVATSGYLPWLNKTSFADISYTVRDLSESTNYRVDNPSLLEGYINEIKPYHVVIKEFTMGYTATDVVSGTVSDFDLPITFNATLNRFVSPQLTYQGASNALEYKYDDTIWTSTPTYKDWSTNYGLSLLDSPEVVVAFVQKYLRPNDNELFVDNARGLPAAGVIRIDAEIISYSQIDRELGKLSGLNRGINATQPAIHIPGVQIVMDVPCVTVLNPSRAYSFVPNVTAHIDTSIYPAPVTPAVLTPVMSDDKVIGINIEDPGEGYVVVPEIIIEPSLAYTFDSTAINGTGFIVINTSDFVTGDLVRSVGTGLNGLTFIPDGYYYVNVLHQSDSGIARMALMSTNISFITFHKSYTDSLKKINPIKFKDPSLLSSNYSHTLGLTAHAVAYTNNTLVRGMRTTLKFDRTSYRSSVQPWIPNHYWSSAYFDASTSTNTTNRLSRPDTEYVHRTGTVSPLGGVGAVFTVSVLWDTTTDYYVTITNGGTGYHVNDTITILGVNLEGDSSNNCVITVKSVDASNGNAIKTIEWTGHHSEANLASLQGAVLPILGLSNVDGNAVVTVDYSYGNILPGQTNGTQMYFYRIHEKYTFNDTSGASFYIFRPTFTGDGMTSTYFMQLVTPGLNYRQNQKLKVLGSLLGGVNGTNDAIITISQVEIDGSIYMAEISGTPVKDFGQYYVKAINDTQLAIFKNPTLSLPVTFGSFSWNGVPTTRTVNGQSVTKPLYEWEGYGYPGTCYGYIPEPLHNNLSAKYRTSSLVAFANTIWQCIESNKDSYFDPTKWVPLSQSDLGLNALDRIEGFYQPTIDMPAKDMQQLLKGVTYPNPVYYGNRFAAEEELPLDVMLEAKPFYPIKPDIKSMIYDGTQYIGVVDTPTHSVLMTSTDSEVWRSTTLSDIPLGVTGITFNDNAYTDLSTNITYHDYIYVITTNTATTSVMISYDLITWLTLGTEADYDVLDWDIGEFDTTAVVAPASPLQGVRFLNGKLFAIGKNILKSDEGLVWKIKHQFYSRLTNVLYDIDYVDNSTFIGYIAVGMGSEIIAGANTSAPLINPVTRILTSSDGDTWTQQEGSLSQYALKSVTHNSSTIVVVGDNSTIFYSINGANWVPGTITGTTRTANINSVAYGNGMFIAVGNKIGTGANDPGYILKSTNGITWSQKSNSSITKENLHDVMFDSVNGFFYATGDNDTILRSVNGNEWISQSNLETQDPTYIVKGNDFLFGYGPEELVPGVITDAISMQVNTAPSAYWDTDNRGEQWYFNTGFSVSKVYGTPDNLHAISFEGAAVNPVAVSVFYFDPAFQGFTRMYENTVTTGNSPYTYSINWVKRTVTLNKALAANQRVLLEVYEVGNAMELARGNSGIVPLRVDTLSGKSYMVLDQTFRMIDIDPLVFVDGVKLENNVDFELLPYQDGTAYPPMKIQFNDLYDPAVNRIVYSILADSVTPFNATQYSYSFPETETFTGTTDSVDGDGVTYVLSLDASGGNISNSIVELDGVRQRPGTDYTITGNLLVLANPVDSSRIVAYTTYHDTSRLRLSTMTATAQRNVNLTGTTMTITMPHPSVPNPMPTINYTDVNTTWVYLNGRRLPTDRYSYGANNQLIITGIDSGDEIIATAMVAGGSPNPTGFKLIVDKSGETSVYRANPQDRAWLTQDFGLSDTVIHVNDVNQLVEVVKFTKDVETIGTNIGFVLEFSIGTVTYIEAFNITTGHALSQGQISLDKANGNSNLILSGSGVSAGDSVQVTLYLGNLIETNGERIMFSSLDPATNTITGLTRNVRNSVAIDHKQFDYVYGLNPSRKMNSAMYKSTWKSSNYLAFGDPLSISTTDAAKFLNDRGI